MVRLVFLGKFRELAAPELCEIALPPQVGTLAALSDWLGRRAPTLAEAFAATPTQIAINQELVRDPSHPVRDGDEIAFLPPMSGG